MTAPITIYRSDTRPALEEAQAFVGGFVELISLFSGDQLLVREDGLLVKGLETNFAASHLAANDSKVALSSRGIVGNAMVLSGEARWLPEDTEEELS